MKRTASAVWHGSLKEGEGKFDTQSGVLKAIPYTFRTRFESDPGTNPEELIAAAHAACFSMALSAELGKAGISPKTVATSAAIEFDKGVLSESRLTTTVVAPGADKAQVEEAAAAAKTGCPISKVLNLEITLDLLVEV